MKEISKVGVMGAGMMGAEIALCFATSGYDVVIKDATLELAQKGKDRLGEVLNKAIKKGKFQAENKASTLSRIIPTDEYDDVEDAGLIVEAVFEHLETKKRFSRSWTAFVNRIVFLPQILPVSP